MRASAAVPALLLGALGGCATLPTSGPTARQVLARPAAGAAAVRVVEIATLPASDPAMATRGAGAGWGFTDADVTAGRIAVGDTLGVSIYEIGTTLFSGAPTGGGGGTSGLTPAPAAGGTVLPPLAVGADGAVTIPYVGRVRVADRLPHAVEDEIRARLRGRSQDPQVIVRVEHGLGSSVIVGGDVRAPGRVPLSLAGERLRDVLALTGGPTGRPADTRVRLTRGGVAAELPLGEIAIGSPADVRLAAGDRIELVRRARSFTALGAARTVAEVAFEAERVSLAEAIARTGGPIDERADARAVFLFRYEPKPGGGEVPTIYRLDLINPASYFAAQRFQMRDKDVVYTANARSNALTKFLSLLNLLVSPAFNAKFLTQ